MFSSDILRELASFGDLPIPELSIQAGGTQSSLQKRDRSYASSSSSQNASSPESVNEPRQIRPIAKSRGRLSGASVILPSGMPPPGLANPTSPVYAAHPSPPGATYQPALTTAREWSPSSSQYSSNGGSMYFSQHLGSQDSLSAPPSLGSTGTSAGVGLGRPGLTTSWFGGTNPFATNDSGNMTGIPPQSSTRLYGEGTSFPAFFPTDPSVFDPSLNSAATAGQPPVTSSSGPPRQLPSTHWKFQGPPAIIAASAAAQAAAAANPIADVYENGLLSNRLGYLDTSGLPHQQDMEGASLGLDGLDAQAFLGGDELGMWQAAPGGFEYVSDASSFSSYLKFANGLITFRWEDWGNYLSTMNSAYVPPTDDQAQ